MHKIFPDQFSGHYSHFPGPFFQKSQNNMTQEAMQLALAGHNLIVTGQCGTGDISIEEY